MKYKPNKQAPEQIAPDSNEHFAYIAGYTEGGVPYGVTWEEMGADELGSGVRKLYKYGNIFSGADPQLLEEDIFKIIIPLTPQAAQQATQQATPQAMRTNMILEFCRTPKNREEIQNFLGLKDREYFRSEILNPLEQGLLHPTIPGKLTSPKQKYYSADAQQKEGD